MNLYLCKSRPTFCIFQTFQPAIRWGFGRLLASVREIKTETTGSFVYNFLVLKNVPEEPKFSVNRTALVSSLNLPTNICE